MKILRRIGFKVAANTMLVFLSCVAVFHVLILTGAVPYSIVWGGRLENASQMYAFETVSLTINMAIIFIIGMKARYIRPFLSAWIVGAVLWTMVVLLLLNTVGNVLSLSTLEAVLFTPLTLIGAALCARIAIE